MNSHALIKFDPAQIFMGVEESFCLFDRPLTSTFMYSQLINKIRGFIRSQDLGTSTHDVYSEHSSVPTFAQVQDQKPE